MIALATANRAKVEIMVLVNIYASVSGASTRMSDAASIRPRVETQTYIS